MEPVNKRQVPESKYQRLRQTAKITEVSPQKRSIFRDLTIMKFDESHQNN